jgi:hypothetical protein
MDDAQFQEMGPGSLLPPGFGVALALDDARRLMHSLGLTGPLPVVGLEVTHSCKGCHQGHAAFACVHPVIKKFDFAFNAALGKK